MLKMCTTKHDIYLRWMGGAAVITQVVTPDMHGLNPELTQHCMHGHLITLNEWEKLVWKFDHFCNKLSSNQPSASL